MTLRIGFIGTGQIAGWHLKGLEALNRRYGASSGALYDLVALCDPRKEAREDLASQAQAGSGRAPNLYSDYPAMLEQEKLDVAALLVPHNLHWPIAKDCLDAGLHL